MLLEHLLDWLWKVGISEAPYAYCDLVWFSRWVPKNGCAAGRAEMMIDNIAAIALADIQR